MSSVKDKSKSQKRGRKKGQSLFRKTERSKGISRLRKRERDRVSRRLSSLLAPDADKKNKRIKRRKRGPKRFKRTTNTLRGLSTNIHKADVLRRELDRVRRSLSAVGRAVANGIDFFIGSSDLGSASLIRR